MRVIRGTSGTYGDVTIRVGPPVGTRKGLLETATVTGYAIDDVRVFQHAKAGIGKNYGIKDRVIWTPERGFERMVMNSPGGFEPASADEVRQFKEDVTKAANEDPFGEVARFVDNHSKLGISKKGAPLIWTQGSDSRYWIKD